MRNPSLQLSLQTSSLVVGFMMWVLISSLMPSIQEDIALTPGQVSLVTAIPVILGSLLRIPVGFYTNRFGARTINLISLITLLFPVFYISIADSFIDLVIGGFILGVGGATFSIGVTSLPKYYPKEKHGLINGIYGVGNIGTAITTFAAPVIAESIGWQQTVQLYLILIILFAALNFILGDKKETKVKNSMLEQIKGVYRNSTLWFLSLFYFVTFGAFVAFTVFLPNFLVNNFNLTPVDAGLRTAGFITLATFVRPLGGWLADKFNAYIILMFIFVGVTISGILLSFSPNIEWYSVGSLAVAIAVGIGNGTIFKLVPFHFSKQAGIVNGIVSAMGGLGGFFPPILLTTVYNMTGTYAIGFMALSQFALVSFVIVIFMYYQDHKNIERKIVDGSTEGIMVTDRNGDIQYVNPAFTQMTGYTAVEAIGSKSTLLNSGKHDPSFYNEMWTTIYENGYWKGEIWNKRNNGELFKVLVTIHSINNNVDEIKYYVGRFTDLSNSAEELKE
ncbi:NNP family nitrate/nitrite transporter-like MFS transporter [Virgibacillus natechei]|uniref:NNP family nitrate/nitrite transporter-like MFS transporter n=1 Tax=Virgibacillus natechei TaxID=1216297 RepID=A0ABS4IHI8_9BACI|nr:nitrate/nitrite transporter [Virgibacillus natechei]MBP1969911.1 NNP family nitrate/nitrite transporter-like MFS transporter [Virgibacillus natechei]UZD13424.1 MFS transporter [Virgibacillus natechei]